MKCLKRVACESKNKELCDSASIVECEAGQTCHALLNILNINKTNATNLTESVDYEIYTAGCWSGSDECLRPVDYVVKFNSSTYLHGDPDNSFQITHNKDYKVPASLLADDLQSSCIVYSPDQHDHNLITKYNKRYCCCSIEMCNAKIRYSAEKNPYVSAFESINTNRIPSFSTKPINSQSNGYYHLNSLTLGLLFVVVFLICLVFYKFRKQIKKNFIFVYNKSQRRLNNLNNDEDVNAIKFSSQSQTLKINVNSAGVASGEEGGTIDETSSLNPKNLLLQSQSKQAIINDFLNGNIESLQQPLLNAAQQQHQQLSTVIPSSVIAPNVHVLPDQLNLFRSKELSSNLNKNNLTKLNNLIEMNQQMMHLKQEKYNDDNDSDSDLQMPNRLKPQDLNLLAKVASGQFSSVWKAVCDTSVQRPAYAVKIFASHHKSAWLNEKEIYNYLFTTNEHILTFYGAYIHPNNNTDFSNNKQKEPQIFFPASIQSSNEYWLLTEYHENGTLHDYLKANCLSWPQMINLCHSILEGLSFLHSESLDHKKTFAIAHRDLKSKNILVKNDGNTCCIGDFGLALKLNNSNKLSSAEIRSKVGTRRYMSPELIEGAIAFTKETFLRIDVYACALTLWEVVSRGGFYEEKSDYKMPFEEEVGLNPSLEEMKEIVVDKCMRPTIKTNWLQYYDIAKVVQTIEECWDIDLDARISSNLAASRIRKIKQQYSI